MTIEMILVGLICFAGGWACSAIWTDLNDDPFAKSAFKPMDTLVPCSKKHSK